MQQFCARDRCPDGGPDGTIKPIEDVRLGDLVWAADPETGEAGPRSVSRLITGHGDKTLIDVEIDGGTVTATDHHPFWVDSNGEWVDAEDLQPGDYLLDDNGVTLLVDDITICQVTDQTVHNLTIDDLHTYFVAVGDQEVLVHNTTCPRPTSGIIDPADVRFSQADASLNFSNGGTISDLSAGLRSGAIDPADVPAIRLAERDGQLFTLDNRRLIAFGNAGVPVPYRMAAPDEIAAEAFKFSTTNGGTSIQLRLFSPFRYQGGSP